MARVDFAARTPGRALRSIVEGAEQELAAPEQAVAPPQHQPLEVGSADDHAERQADEVAERVLARLAVPAVHDHDHGPPDVRRAPGGAGAIGAAGGALDAASSQEIQSARGGGASLDAGVRREMEAGFGHGLGDVRIHTDARADDLSRQMSARAFTTGRDIFFARGEYDPASESGKHTLAHELAHTVQEGGAARRKLRGTADALVSQGDVSGDQGKSSGKLRKLVGKLTYWDKIVAAVRAYEAEEGKLLGGGANPLALTNARPGLLKLLTKVQGHVKDWRKSNESEDQDAKVDKARTGDNGQTTSLKADPRTKAGRRQAIALLEPRVGNEISLLSAKDTNAWSSSLGLSSTQGVATGRVFGGQMNTVTEVAYQTESGDLTGFFKEDKGFNADLQSHEDTVGIKQQDPNYGARSVALYRLDQLFDAKVTARAEFAVHKTAGGKSVLGTVLETAVGPAAAKSTFGTTKAHTDSLRQQGDATAVSLDDPVLQRGLNKLQILDAIAGQLDRHAGNYHIDSDAQGNVLGVTGIDLDMAFGSKMDGVDKSKADGAFNYKGLPEFVDEDMGLRILKVQPGDVRAALTGLLPKGEVEATVARFREVQTAVMDAQQNGKLRGSWGGSHVKEGSTFADLGDKWHDRPTYLDEAKGGAYYELLAQIGGALTAIVPKAFQARVGTWDDLPDDVTVALEKSFGFFKEGGLYGPLLTLAEGLWQAQAADQATAATVAVVKQTMDLSTVDRVWIDIQEGHGDKSHAVNAKAAMEERIKTVAATLLPKLKAGAKNNPTGRGRS